jgi:ubiquitin-conjugating enzyme E2 W
MFTGRPPLHEHVYSNGYICLSTLYEWTPNLNVSVLVLSIISMLSSAERKAPPENDAEIIAEYADVSPKDIDWTFEDTSC